MTAEGKQALVTDHPAESSEWGGVFSWVGCLYGLSEFSRCQVRGTTPTSMPLTV